MSNDASILQMKETAEGIETQEDELSFNLSIICSAPTRGRTFRQLAQVRHIFGREIKQILQLLK